MKFEVKSDVKDNKYLVEIKNDVVKIHKWAGPERTGEWRFSGEGYWSGKHIVYCTAKLDSYDYLTIENSILDRVLQKT